MEIYCLENFKTEFEKLKSKKSYDKLEQEIINYFFNKTPHQLCSGTRLNHSNDTPYLKKRLGGRAGFRCYFLLVIKNNKLYLMFVHPKTGSQGAENITDDSKTSLYKKVLECIESNNLYKLELNNTKDKIIFNRL